MTNVLNLVLMAVALAAATPAAPPAVSVLQAEQSAPIPAAGAPGPLSFQVAVRGGCTDASHALSVSGMLGDTLLPWQAVDADGSVALSLQVPRSELVFTAASLCRRAGPVEAGSERLLPGAFSAQVFARCIGADGRAAMRATSAPLSVRYACPDAPPTPR